MKFPKQTIAFLAALWALGTGVSSHAQDASAPVTLTLEKAEALALAGNPSLLSARDRSEAAGKRVLPAYLPNDPMLMVERTGQTRSPLDWGGADMEMWMAEEQVRFPGKSLAEGGIRGAEARKAEAESRDARRMALRAAREAYWDFYLRAKTAGLLAANEDRWKRLGAAFKDRDLSGQGRSLKSVRMRMELLKAANERRGAQRALEISRAELSRVLGADPSTRWVLGEASPLAAPPDLGDAARGAAVERNPSLSSAKASLEAAKGAQRLAALEHLPDFVVRAYGERVQGASGFSDYGMRVGVSVPLFFPFRQTREAQAAAREASAAEAEFSDAKGRAATSLAEALAEAATAWDLLRDYEEAGFPKALPKAWEDSFVAYRNEQLSPTEAAEDLNLYLETSVEYERARADYGKALARLDYELGDFAPQGGKP